MSEKYIRKNLITRDGLVDAEIEFRQAGSGDKVDIFFDYKEKGEYSAISIDMSHLDFVIKSLTGIKEKYDNGKWYFKPTDSDYARCKKCRKLYSNIEDEVKCVSCGATDDMFTEK